MGINQTLSSHIPRNLKRFPMKPNIGIATDDTMKKYNSMLVHDGSS